MPGLARTALAATVFAVASTQAVAQDLVVWWNKSYYPEEDEQFDKTVAAFEKESGLDVEYVYYTNEDVPRKVLAALTAGQPPDLAYGFLFDLEKVRRVGGHGFYLRNGIEANGRLKSCTSGVDDSDPAPSSMVDSIVSGSIRVEAYGGASMAYQDYGTCTCVMHRNEVFDGNFFLGGTLSGGCPRTNRSGFSFGTNTPKAGLPCSQRSSTAWRSWARPGSALARSVTTTTNMTWGRGRAEDIETLRREFKS